MWSRIAHAAHWLCEPEPELSSAQPHRDESILKDEVGQLEASLDEMRRMLSHEQMISQELRAQLKEQTRRLARLSEKEEPHLAEVASLGVLLEDRLKYAKERGDMRLSKPYIELEQAFASLQ